MSYCTNCGTPGNAAFCHECGNKLDNAFRDPTPFPSAKPTQITPSAESHSEPPLSPQTTKKKQFPVKWLIVGAGVVVIVITMIFVIPALIPYSLSSAQAKEKLLSKNEIDFKTQKGEINTFEDQDLPVFNMSEDCKADVSIAKLVKKGNVIADINWEAADSTDSIGGIEEFVIEFENSDQANSFIELANNGTSDEDCTYFYSDTIYSEITQSGTANDVVGIGGNNSFAFTAEGEVDVSSLDWYWDTYDLNVYIAKGKYVFAVEAQLVPDEGSVSIPEVEDAVYLAVEKLVK